MKPTRVAWTLVAVVFLAGTVCRAQSLSDIAKKEEERRKAVKAPTKVYTNDDLKQYPTPPPSPAAEAATPPAVPAPGDKAAPGDKPADKPADATKPVEEEKGEAYWKGLISAARTKLERDQSYRDALETRINALTNDFYARDDPAQRAVIWTQRTKALEEMERLKQEVKDDAAAIEKVQDDARKAGVPPGWLR
jgi:hypothetical protein